MPVACRCPAPPKAAAPNARGKPNHACEPVHRVRGRMGRPPHPRSLLLALLAACSASDPTPDPAPDAAPESAQHHSAPLDTPPPPAEPPQDTFFEGSEHVWLDARSRGVTFRAIGQEPGWVLEIEATG